MKSLRLKKWLLAASGLIAFQVAGCNFADQLTQLQGTVTSFLASLPGFGP
jgi:hypothetical protein